MIEEPQEENYIELPLRTGQVVHLHLLEDDPVLNPEEFRRPLRLSQVVSIDIYAGNLRAASRELETVEAGVAADIQNSVPFKPFRYNAGNLPPFECREIAERMFGSSLRAVRQVKIVVPGAKLSDLALQSGNRPPTRIFLSHRLVYATLSMMCLIHPLKSPVSLTRSIRAP